MLFTYYYCHCDLSSDCGSVHIYETPFLLYSSELFSTGSSGGTSLSGRSVESDLTSSTEVDSGYASSVDIRRFSSSTGDNSPEQQNANFEALYENTSIRKQDAKGTLYELMSPPAGHVSNPIPIPNPGTGQPRYSREQHGTQSSPPSTDQKCPLDLSNFGDLELSGCKPTSRLSTKISTSLPSSSVVQYQDKPRRLSKTVSPPTGKLSPLKSSVGETFVQEMFAFLTSGDKSSDASSSKVEEEDIYEDLSRPCEPVPAFPSERGEKPPASNTSLKANRVHSYENHRISVKEQNTKNREPREDQNSQHEAPEHDQDRVRCKSTYQLQNDHQLRDARCNTWPTQQNYDNHKLKDADTASSSGSPVYDNHKLRPSETNVRSFDEYYDNWKIKNDTSDSAKALHRVTHACYENIELQTGKSIANKEEHSQEGLASYKQEKETPPNKARTAEQRYENCVLNSKHSSHGNVAPKVLQNGTLESDQTDVSDSLYENCEIEGKKKKSQEEGTFGLTIPRQQDKNDRKLCHSLPTNCHCIGVVPDELDGFARMILEKRNPPALTRVGSADAITVDGDKDDPLNFRLNGDRGHNVDFQDHPVPPPRWKRIARMKRTQSLIGSSQQRWEMVVSPELATVLSRRWNGTLAGVSAESNQDTNSMSNPPLRALEIMKPALPPRANKNNVVDAKPLSTSSNAYENVALPSKPSGKETCLPELPPKVKRWKENGTVKNGSLNSRAMHYENIVGINGFHVVCNKKVQPQLESDSPPPLPRKRSQTKVLRRCLL